VTNRQGTLGADRDRLLVAHVENQAIGLASWMLAPAGHEHHVFHNHVVGFDDASMWVPSLAQASDPGAELVAHHMAAGREAFANTLRRHRRRGRITQAPVLNSVEHICKRVVLPGGHLGAAVHVHSPAQVLPEANWSTVADRLRNWLTNAGRPTAGERIDPRGAMTQALASRVRSNLSFTKDCLVLNGNIIWSIEKELRLLKEALPVRDRGYVPSLFHLNCQAHSIVLCNKPLIDNIPGVSTCITRAGHLHGASRSAAKYSAGLDAEFECAWRYKRVLAMPPGHEEWERCAWEVRG